MRGWRRAAGWIGEPDGRHRDDTRPDEHRRSRVHARRRRWFRDTASDLDHHAGPRGRLRRGHRPATCEGLLTAGRWQFANAPLNDPAVVGSPVAIPKSVFDPVRQSDGKRLYCVWRDPRADITNVAIEVEVVDSSKAFGVLQGLQGFDCAHDAEGYRCQKVSTDEQYGVPIGITYFTRGDIAIDINQANVPTTGLLDDVMAHLF